MIKCHIADIGGQLTKVEGRIKSAFDRFVTIATKTMGAKKIEACFIPSSNDVIPQLGVGGYSPGPNNLLVYLDPNFDDISEVEILATLLHESHHCMRWRDPGYGRTLGQAMVSEGLASLYEQECLGKTPIYVNVDLQKEQVEQAKKHFDQVPYDRGRWFFGRESLPIWFGYALGYRLCR